MNGNIFNGQQNTNGFYPYQYHAAMPAIARPDASAYMIPQASTSAFIKGRPVSSFEEAKVAPVDLDGSVFIFPDFGNKKIYTKQINADGTATIQSFVLDAEPIEQISPYATREEFDSLKATLDEVLAKIKASTTTTQPKLNF